MLIFCNFASYQWLLNSVPIPGATSQTYTAVANGTYRVKVKDANGCESFSDPEFLYDLGVNNTSNIATQIKLYPNPAKELVHIKGVDQISKVKIRIDI